MFLLNYMLVLYNIDNLHYFYNLLLYHVVCKNLLRSLQYIVLLRKMSLLVLYFQSFQRSFFAFPPSGWGVKNPLVSERDCKGSNFFRTSKTFWKNFQKNSDFSTSLEMPPPQPGAQCTVTSYGLATASAAARRQRAAVASSTVSGLQVTLDKSTPSTAAAQVQEAVYLP